MLITISRDVAHAFISPRRRMRIHHPSFSTPDVEAHLLEARRSGAKGTSVLCVSGGKVCKWAECARSPKTSFTFHGSLLGRSAADDEAHLLESEGKPQAASWP